MNRLRIAPTATVAIPTSSIVFDIVRDLCGVAVEHRADHSTHGAPAVGKALGNVDQS